MHFVGPPPPPGRWSHVLRSGIPSSVSAPRAGVTTWLTRAATATPAQTLLRSDRHLAPRARHRGSFPVLGCDSQLVNGIVSSSQCICFHTAPQPLHQQVVDADMSHQILCSSALAEEGSAWGAAKLGPLGSVYPDSALQCSSISTRWRRFRGGLTLCCLRC